MTGQEVVEMMDIMELLFQAGKKNDVIDEQLVWDKAVKRMESVSIEDPGVSFQKIRDAVLGMGRILEENQEEQYYLLIANVGLSAAVLVARASEGVAEAAAYAEEGIIRQQLTHKALEMFKTRLSSLQSYPRQKDD